MAIATFISIFSSVLHFYFFMFLHLCMHNWFIDVFRNVTSCVQLPLDYLILHDNGPSGANLWKIKHRLSGCVP